jgi:hypothetical protein
MEVRNEAATRAMKVYSRSGVVPPGLRLAELQELNGDQPGR